MIVSKLPSYCLRMIPEVPYIYIYIYLDAWNSNAIWKKNHTAQRKVIYFISVHLLWICVRCGEVDRETGNSMSTISVYVHGIPTPGAYSSWYMVLGFGVIFLLFLFEVEMYGVGVYIRQLLCISIWQFCSRK